MNDINNYISEKLIINKNLKFKSGPDESDFIYPIKKKSGEKYLWFKWWEYLRDNGPMSKHDLLTEFGLKPTSYATEFAKLNRRNIIVPIKGKLEAKEPETWVKCN